MATYIGKMMINPEKNWGSLFSDKPISWGMMRICWEYNEKYYAMILCMCEVVVVTHS